MNATYVVPIADLDQRANVAFSKSRVKIATNIQYFTFIIRLITISKLRRLLVNSLDINHDGLCFCLLFLSFFFLFLTVSPCFFFFLILFCKFRTQLAREKTNRSNRRRRTTNLSFLLARLASEARVLSLKPASSLTHHRCADADTSRMHRNNT